MPDLTVIIATFNSEKTLARTLDSILAQQISNFECVVIDGASKDQTTDIIESYEIKFEHRGVSFKWISEPDTGIYDAWNKGLNIATGEWISFLGSDDIYLEDALQSYQRAIRNIPSDKIVHLVYSNVDYVEDSIKILDLNGVWSWNKFKRYMCIAHVGSFHNKIFFATYGHFDPTYKICGDYELLLRPKENLKTLKLEKTTALMEAGGISNHLEVRLSKKHI